VKKRDSFIPPLDTKSEIPIVRKTQVKSEQQQRNVGSFGSSLILGIETVVMEMVLSKFYWVNGIMFKLYEGKEAAKV
jgi:galactitol-specific phosphotransferase system IIC component